MTSGLVLIFTLCGIPQYFVIADASGSIDGPPRYIASKMKRSIFKQMLESDDYVKKFVKVDPWSGTICT